MEPNETANSWRETIIGLETGAATSEYFRWHENELEIRGFLISSNRGMNKLFNEHWEEASAKASLNFDPDYDDASTQYDLFIDSLDVDPMSYYWQLSSAAVKDACSLYEVFLERAADEVVRHFGARLSTLSTEDSWNWTACRAFYQSYLNFDVRPSPVDEIIWMRNKMTHLRNELRTKAGVAEFKEKLQRLGVSGPPSADERSLNISDNLPLLNVYLGVEISQLQTYRLLDLIRSQVNRLALHLFRFVNGTDSTTHLDALRSASPIHVKGFNAGNFLAY